MAGAGLQEEAEPLELLRQGAALIGQELTDATVAQFALYLEELKLWNTRINLTALKSDRDIINKHFLDSLAVLPFMGQGDSLADLGSGAGFPGLVIKLVRPALSLTLVESRGKKAAFLTYMVTRLGLTTVAIVQEYLTPRLARRWGPRFAIVVSRAAFPLPQFLKLAAPLLLPGGRLLALKGPEVETAELHQAQESLKGLNLSNLHLHPYILPLSGTRRLMVSAEKR